MKDRKPRASEIRVGFENDQVLTGMNVADDGTLTFFDENGEPVQPAKIEVGKTYLRPAKPPKVLTRSPADASSIQLEPNRLLMKYTWLVAADTNTVEVNGTRVSVTSSVLIRDIVVDARRWSAKLHRFGAFEFHDATEPPERVGWHEVIEGISRQPEIRGSIGVVVDSDLNNLAAINSREKPLLGDSFLPKSFELLYGCGDRGTEEFITNAAIADCDRVASRRLDRLQSEGLVGGYNISTSRPHGRYKYWDQSSMSRDG